MTSVGLIVALPGEKQTLTRARIPPGRFSRLNENTLVCLSGIGPEKAEAAATLLIGEGCRALMSWGCAAAIGPGLKPGDLLLPERVLDALGNVFSAEPGWRRSLLARLPKDLQIRTGDLTESRTIVETAEAKRALHDRTGACGLDMESAAIAGLAFRANLPFVSIRAVVDPMDMDLPKPVAAAMNHDGAVEMPLLLASIARHPGALPGLIRLGRYFRAATRTLTLCARRLEYDFSPDTSGNRFLDEIPQ